MQTRLLSWSLTAAWHYWYGITFCLFHQKGNFAAQRIYQGNSKFIDNLFNEKSVNAQVFSWKFCEISKNTFFTEHLWGTASESFKNLLQSSFSSKYVRGFNENLEAFSLPGYEHSCLYHKNLIKNKNNRVQHNHGTIAINYYIAWS